MISDKTWNSGEFLIHEFASLESTNDLAFFGANNHNLNHGEIIFSHQQTKGRGKGDRTWISPTGNLYFSLVLKPKISPQNSAQLSFLAAAALRLTLEKLAKKNDLCTLQIKNKWPNDIIINHHKIAGLLLQNKSDQNSCQFVILGIGVNINSHPQNTNFAAGNLQDFGVKISNSDFLKLFLHEFSPLYQTWTNFGSEIGFEKIRQVWLEGAYKIKEEILVSYDDQNSVRGIFETIDGEGNLLLRTTSTSENQEVAANNLIKISAADIF